MDVRLNGKTLAITFPYDPVAVEMIKGLPQRRWNKTAKRWECKPSYSNMKYLRGTFPEARWDAESCALWVEAEIMSSKRDVIAAGEVNFDALKGVLFKKPPMKHQMKALLLARDMPYFAYLMDQGTGKTKTTIDDAAHNWREDRIDAMLVISPNSVKTNWVMAECHKTHPSDMDAIEDHMPDDVPVVKGVWISSANAQERQEWELFEKRINEAAASPRSSLVLLSVNVDALNVGRCFEFLQAFVDTFRTMLVVDEATKIAKRGSKRTKAAMKLRSACPVARVLTGTPVTKSPMNAFSIFGFLHEDILGFGNFYSFRNRYCVMGGYMGKQVLNYRNMDQLADSIASCSFRVLKRDCLDLPPQVYLKRRVTLSPPQAKAYAQMVAEMKAEWKDDEIEAPIVLTQLLRLQEIVGGYLPIITPEGDRVGVHELVAPEKNPKFTEVLNIIEDADEKFVVWSRFIPEIEAIGKLLTEKGYKIGMFYGATPERERTIMRKQMLRGELDGIVGNPAAGGLGIDEFKVAPLSIYLSNSFDTEARVQSEDRQHRFGSDMHDKITYWDIMAPNTVDVKIIRTMRNNVEVATAVMKDGWREWI